MENKSNYVPLFSLFGEIWKKQKLIGNFKKIHILEHKSFKKVSFISREQNHRWADKQHWYKNLKAEEWKKNNSSVSGKSQMMIFCSRPSSESLPCWCGNRGMCRQSCSLAQSLAGSFAMTEPTFRMQTVILNHTPFFQNVTWKGRWIILLFINGYVYLTVVRTAVPT